MKKLVLGLALLLTSENIARGLPIYTRTSWKNFSSYDLLLNIKEEKLIMMIRGICLTGQMQLGMVYIINA